MSWPRSESIGVIGGGLGGLAAACTLAARGRRVTLFEKSQWLGGKAAVLESDGFRFDMGPTIFTLPAVLRRIFAEAGRDLEKHLPLIRLDPQWRSFFSDGSTLDLVADPQAMAERLRAFSPDTQSDIGYRQFLEFSARLHSISERQFFWRSVGSLADMVSVRSLFQPGLLLDVLRMRPGQTVAASVRAHVSDARVAQMLDHFTQYVGSAPDASPAVLCGIAHMQTSEGIWYPAGGLRAVALALVQLACELGVEMRPNVGIRRILVENGAAVGVETDTGEEIALAAVVSNADAVRTHRELLGGAAAQRFERRRAYEPACSGVVLYLGLDRGYDHLLHHNFVFSRDAEEEFETIYRRGEPAADPTCYVCAPARTDPSVAPPGGEALYVLVHTPYLRPHHDWKALLPAYRRTILKKLADGAGLVDLEQRIHFESCLTPEDIHARYQVLNGAIYGLASHGRLTGAFKPPNRSPDIKGLYFAGGAAHPGPGVPMVLMSGWIAADCLDAECAKPRAERVVKIDHVLQSSQATAGAPALPQRSKGMVKLFRHYCRSLLRRNFHGVRLSLRGRPENGAGPLIIVLNHPSWWDPLLAIQLADLFPQRSHYAPMDAAMLGKYGIFRKLGFFGIEPGTTEGALAFLRTATALLSQPGTALWVTAQGQFTDPRQRPVRLRRGLGHLLRRLEGGVVIPLALEYPFWNERYPEALARFGEPLPIGAGRNLSAAEWTARLEMALTATQDALALEAQQRDPRLFETLLDGASGIGGIYDVWRRFKAWLRGERFVAAHEEEKPAALEVVS